MSVYLEARKTLYMPVRILREKQKTKSEKPQQRDADKSVEVEPASTDTPTGERAAQKRQEQSRQEHQEAMDEADANVEKIDELLEELAAVALTAEEIFPPNPEDSYGPSSPNLRYIGESAIYLSLQAA